MDWEDVRVCTDTNQARRELEEIAKEFNLPLGDKRVVLEWGNRGVAHNQKVFDEVLYPLYFKKWHEKHGC